MGSAKSAWATHLLNHMTAIGMLYVVLLPICGLLFVIGLMPSKIALPFFLILILEHLTQEMYRILIAMHDQTAATIILFLRSGIWVLAIIPAMYAKWVPAEIDNILNAWIAGGVLSLIFGMRAIGVHLETPLRAHLNWKFIIGGLKTGILFLSGGILAKSLFTVDRYLFENLNNMEILAAYVVFSGIAMAMLSVIEASIFSFLYPKLVSSIKLGDLRGYKEIKREIWLSVCIALTLMSVIIWQVTPFLLKWIDKQIYLEYVEILWLLIAVVSLYCINVIPQYQLYGFGADKILFWTHLVGAIAFLSITMLIAKLDTVTAVPGGLLGALAIQLFLRLRFVRSSESKLNA